ncbi:MAG: pilus assembly protein [Propionicimonas sp.]|jgi:Flp pilus assembly protein TadG
MNQRGFSESTQWAVLTPVVLLLVLGLVQLGVWLHARTVAAEAAATVADLQAAGLADAVDAGQRITAGAGLKAVHIATVTEPTVVVVTVTGRAPLFFDVGQGMIQERAVSPRERLR